LADTICDATEHHIANQSATGFSFSDYTPEALAAATLRALGTYRESKETWDRIVETGMRQDWSWARSAHDMLDVYGRAREFAATEGRL
jgi:starch synthase